MPRTATRMARVRAPLERSLYNLLERYTIHDLIHALVETCYRRAGREEEQHPGEVYYISHWREVARQLARLEQAVAGLEP